MKKSIIKKYIILGHGMLGRYMVLQFARSGNNNRCIITSRKHLDVLKVTPQDIKQNILAASDLQDGDPIVINCIGMIKPEVDKYGVKSAIEVNSIFPHVLANICEELQFPLIHITTDCVFSGKKGNYTEKDPHDALDVYGKTKSLGEPENCTVIRTSIIGEEVGQARSLVEWIKSNAGKTVNGFTNHLWNGVTCLQLSKVVEQIARRSSFWKGVRHVYSPTAVNKLELVKMVNDIYNLGITVIPTQAKEACDRTLTNDILTHSGYDIPELYIQIQEMKEFKL